jgi:hypothetical protein
LIALACLLGPIGCYRPAATYGENVGGRVSIAGFASTTGYPELEVYAQSYLAQRLAEHGVATANNEAPVAVRGALFDVRERPLWLGQESSVVELAVTGRTRVESSAGDTCETPSFTGRSLLDVPLNQISEPARLTALQSATMDAIDAMLLDLLWCLDQVATGP